MLLESVLKPSRLSAMLRRLKPKLKRKEKKPMKPKPRLRRRSELPVASQKHLRI